MKFGRMILLRRDLWGELEWTLGEGKRGESVRSGCSETAVKRNLDLLFFSPFAKKMPPKRNAAV